MSRERRSKLDPLSRIITLGDIDCIEVNEIIQDIYEINDESRDVLYSFYEFLSDNRKAVYDRKNIAANPR